MICLRIRCIICGYKMFAHAVWTTNLQHIRNVRSPPPTRFLFWFVFIVFPVYVCVCGCEFSDIFGIDVLYFGPV